MDETRTNSHQRIYEYGSTLFLFQLYYIFYYYHFPVPRFSYILISFWFHRGLDQNLYFPKLPVMYSPLETKQIRFFQSNKKKYIILL